MDFCKSQVNFVITAVKIEYKEKEKGLQCATVTLTVSCCKYSKDCL